MPPAQEANSDVRWFKSSYSGGSGSDCVEVAFSGQVASVRDSKIPRRGMLIMPTSVFASFIESMEAISDGMRDMP
ncbi:DUF397 domain-containing protein [Streptomyces sp. ME02-8801-2C]|uniref:DUF397 domain-containing protein n=1 Tax=Streptomyces sp. ME02-8801-2C TaxID=3028680 RepID=UPI0029A2245B|nr:DUF397 domain-containing protein [Streptomyces sp. ME02-8801-2C]MDX3453186.1 DUF397 domain-containing protein [Streptomyces sp. ME02-8801-2C]